MANVFEYIFNVGGDFSAQISGMTDATGQFTGAVTAASDKTKTLASTFAEFSYLSDIAKKASNVIGDITSVGATAELQLMNMKTLYGGNAEAAQEMYERISEYGKVTPYDKAGLLEAQKTMMSFGISGEKAFETLKQIGDIAMGDKAKMQSLSLAFAQMSSTGKLTGQDLMQMINAGFNPLNEISAMTGKSISELKEEMSKGAISADMVSEAFRRATSEGGLFYGAIDEASNTAAGRMASIRDSIDEIKVSIFNATGDFGIWVDAAAQVATPLSEIYPVLQGVWSVMIAIKNLNWTAMWSQVRGCLYAARIQMLMMNRELVTGQFASNGFLINITRATLAVVRFATVGIFQALKGLGALILSFITSGTASATFATIASGAFGAFKLAAVTACRAVSVAISSIPIIGWIAAAIAALIAIGVYFWNTSAKFRAVIKGLWASFKAFFSALGALAKTVFGAIGDLIKAAFSLDGDGISRALSKLKQGYSDFGSQIGKAFNDAYDAEMAEAKKEEEAKKKKEQPEDPLTGVPQVEVPQTPATSDPTAGTLTGLGSGASSAGDKIKNITVNIEKLVERFEIHTTNLQGDIARVKDMVSDALLSALNDVNLA